MSNNKVQGKILASNSCVVNAYVNEMYSNCFEVASGQVCHVYGSNTVWDNTVEQTLSNPLLNAKLGGANVIGALYVHDGQFGANATTGHTVDQRRFYTEVFDDQASDLTRPLLGAYTTYEATASSQQILFAAGVRDSASHQKKYELQLDRRVSDPYAGFYRWTSSQANPYKGMIFDMAIGYGGVVRGTVTQITSRTTGVSLDALHGIITCYTYASTVLAPGEMISFTLTNTFIQNGDYFHVAVIDNATSQYTKAYSSDWGGNLATINVKNEHLSNNENASALKLAFYIIKNGGQLGIAP
jgi:hypothetical protein